MAKRRKQYRRKADRVRERNLRVIMTVIFVLLILGMIAALIFLGGENVNTDHEGGSAPTKEGSEETNRNEPKSSNLLTFLANGSVQWEFTESFSEDYYDFDELKSTVESEIAEFSEEGKGKMELVSCELAEENVTVCFLFDSIESFVTYYNEFTRPAEEIYITFTTPLQAQEEGYVFEELYEDVVGETSYLAEELMENPQVRVIITNLSIDVSVEYTLLCTGESVTAKENWFSASEGEVNMLFVSLADEAEDEPESESADEPESESAGEPESESAGEP